MTTCDMQGCDRPTRDDAYMCDHCGDRLARVLGEMEWLGDELETTIAKMRASSFSDGGQSAEKPLIYVEAASAKRDGLRNALVSAIRFCAEEGVRNSSPDGDEYPEDTLTAMGRWLLWRVDGLALSDMGAEVVGAILDAARDCRRMIDSPPERRYTGPCPECARDLYHRPDATEVSCRGCGSRWDVGEVTAWMADRIKEHMTDRLVTAREGSTLLGRLGLPVEQGTIDKWRERSRITEAGREPAKGERPGARLYRWDDLLTLAAKVAS